MGSEKTAPVLSNGIFTLRFRGTMVDKMDYFFSLETASVMTKDNLMVSTQ